MLLLVSQYPFLCLACWLLEMLGLLEVLCLVEVLDYLLGTGCEKSCVNEKHLSSMSTGSSSVPARRPTEGRRPIGIRHPAHSISGPRAEISGRSSTL